MKKLSLAVPLVLTLVLAGCATSYQSEGITGGYSETKVGPAQWSLLFAGNGYTTYETVQTFWLYRAAEFTLKKGYDGFKILTPIPLVAFHGGKMKPAPAIYRHARGEPGLRPIQVQEKPAIIATIQLLKEPFTPVPKKVFDARKLKAALEPYVKGKLCGGNVCPHVHSYLLPPLPSSPPPLPST